MTFFKDIFMISFDIVFVKTHIQVYVTYFSLEIIFSHRSAKTTLTVLSMMGLTNIL